MSNTLRKNYKLIIGIGVGLILLPLFPLMLEMIYSLGTYVGTFIRQIGTNGMCV